jgi:hypothetical protein
MTCKPTQHNKLFEELEIKIIIIDEFLKNANS